MKKILFAFIFTFLALTASAQPPQARKFDPERFNREQECFIVKEACLSKQECNAFLPVFREYMAKQREIFKAQRQLAKEKPQDDKAAAALISKFDKLEMDMTKLRAMYHTKFVKIIGAKKVIRCIQAEQRFKHQTMERVAVGHHRWKSKDEPKH